MPFLRSRSLLLAVAWGAVASAYAPLLAAQGAAGESVVVPPRLLHAPPVALPQDAETSEPVSVELTIRGCPVA